MITDKILNGMKGSTIKDIAFANGKIYIETDKGTFLFTSSGRLTVKTGDSEESQWF